MLSPGPFIPCDNLHPSFRTASSDCSSHPTHPSTGFHSSSLLSHVSHTQLKGLAQQLCGLTQTVLRGSEGSWRRTLTAGRAASPRHRVLPIIRCVPNRTMYLQVGAAPGKGVHAPLTFRTITPQLSNSKCVQYSKAQWKPVSGGSLGSQGSSASNKPTFSPNCGMTGWD